MEEIQSFQNNELLTGIAILRVLKATKKLEITKCLVIGPLLSYKSIRNYIKKTSTKVRSIEELIVKQNIAFANFNQRYQEKLPLSINSIFLMSQLKLLRIENNNLVFYGENFDFNEQTLGKTAKDTIDASSNLVGILMRESASSIYLSLRIEL